MLLGGLFWLATLLLTSQTSKPNTEAPNGWLPGKRVLLDAHNCYPYDGRWSDRLERALRTGVPLAVEQDLLWYHDKGQRKSRSVVSHGKPASGSEPTLESYFFEPIRPIMERALQDSSQKDWPLITLNLDFKSDETEHHEAIWELLGKYEAWLCTAERVQDFHRVMPIELKPLLVLTGDAEKQEKTFHDQVPLGHKLRLFGAVHVEEYSAESAPTKMVRFSATNYRRWWNNPWRVVEKEGQSRAGDWTSEGMRRLQSLVDHAHAMGLWIRFYNRAEGASQGWNPDYNFGSEERVLTRWRAAIQAGVDFVATDQYEALAKALH